MAPPPILTPYTRFLRPDRQSKRPDSPRSAGDNASVRTGSHPTTTGIGPNSLLPQVENCHKILTVCVKPTDD